MMKKLNPDYDVPHFNFKSFPNLEVMFCSIENHLNRPIPGAKIETDRNKKALILLKNIQKSVSDCKNCLDAVMGWVAEIEDKVKLVKKSERFRKRQEQETSPV